MSFVEKMRHVKINKLQQGDVIEAKTSKGNIVTVMTHKSYPDHVYCPDWDRYGTENLIVKDKVFKHEDLGLFKRQ